MPACSSSFGLLQERGAEVREARRWGVFESSQECVSLFGLEPDVLVALDDGVPQLRGERFVVDQAGEFENGPLWNGDAGEEHWHDGTGPRWRAGVDGRASEAA